MSESHVSFNDDSEKERRSYFRIEECVYIEYRPVTTDELAQIKNHSGKLKPKKDEFSVKLEQLDRELSPMLAIFRRENPGLTQYLEVLNKKIDVITSHLVFDQFKKSAEDKTIITTTRTIDISEGGVSFNRPEPYGIGEYFHIKLVVVDARFGIDTYGQVIHCHLEDSDEDRRVFRIGVEFPVLYESDRKLLMRYILDRQRELIRKRKS